MLTGIKQCVWDGSTYEADIEKTLMMPLTDLTIFDKIKIKAATRSTSSRSVSSLADGGGFLAFFRCCCTH